MSLGFRVGLTWLMCLIRTWSWTWRLQISQRQLKEIEQVEGQWSFWELAWQKVYWHYSFIVRSLSPGSLCSLPLIKKKNTHTHTEFCAEHTLTRSHAHFCANMHSHTCPPQDLQLDLVPPLETCATLIYSSGSYILHAVHIVYAHTHTHTHTQCTLLGEESLTFSSITIWKGGYTEAWLQWRYITQANILSLTSWRSLGFDMELKIDIVHPHRNRFPCQRCMRMICFNFSSVFRCLRSLVHVPSLCTFVCLWHIETHIFAPDSVLIPFTSRTCSCKYNLIWMFKEFIELACGSKWFPCRRCYRTDSWSIS